MLYTGTEAGFLKSLYEDPSGRLLPDLWLFGLSSASDRLSGVKSSIFNGGKRSLSGEICLRDLALRGGRELKIKVGELKLNKAKQGNTFKLIKFSTAEPNW